MLMRGMLRRLPLFALALALWFAVEPMVHSHPLRTSGGSPNVCAVCAAGLDRPIAAPAVVAPLLVIAMIDDVPALAAPAIATVLLPSRAPPPA